MMMSRSLQLNTGAKPPSPPSPPPPKAESQTPPLGVAFVRKGFRPFFLVGGVFASAIIPMWLALLDSPSSRASAHFGSDVVTWHAHEMIFGYAVAVIAGFLLTAVSNWTQRETLVGSKLVALTAVWVFGRIMMSMPSTWARSGWHAFPALAAAVDLAFLPLLTIALARPLIAARNGRNFVMLIVLAVLFAANAVAHAEVLGVRDVPLGAGRNAMLIAVDVVVLLCVIIGGRVIPMFTRNAVAVALPRSSGEEPVIKGIPMLDKLALVAMIALILVDVFVGRVGLVANLISGFAGTAVAARALRWGSLRTFRHPLLWVLHLGYAWISIGLMLRAATPNGSLALHVLTVGTIGTLTLGMMARVALGHTGRPLMLPKPRLMTSAFALITLAVLVRVGGPLLWPSASYLITLAIAGAAWTAAFTVFVGTYAPILIAARIDGKPG